MYRGGASDAVASAGISGLVKPIFQLNFYLHLHNHLLRESASFGISLVILDLVCVFRYMVSCMLLKKVKLEELSKEDIERIKKLLREMMDGEAEVVAEVIKDEKGKKKIILHR